MHVLFDITHPAHVHLFKNLIFELESESHDTTVLSREKDMTTRLLDSYDIDHTPLSRKRDNKFWLMPEWSLREIRTVGHVINKKPDVIVSRLNPPAAHASALLNRPNLVFDDSEKEVFAGRITHPFTDIICTPENFSRDLGPKQRRYRGFHELAYLHPDRFTPDPDVLKEHEIDPADHYSVLRFVSWGAHHDVNEKGLSQRTKKEIVEMLSRHGKVFITAEDELPSEFEEHRLPIPPEKIHQLMYHANMYVGDSQTMATEAAILGTPAIRCNSFAGEDDMSNFVMLESKYGLLTSTDDEKKALATVEEYLKRPNIQQEWKEKQKRLAEDMIDVTSFMRDLIEEAGS